MSSNPEVESMKTKMHAFEATAKKVESEVGKLKAEITHIENDLKVRNGKLLDMEVLHKQQVESAKLLQTEISRKEAEIHAKEAAEKAHPSTPQAHH